MTIAFVVTEHPSFLGGARRARFERARVRLERLAGVPVASVDYPDLDDLGDAASVVLSGSFAPWAAHDPRALERLGEVVLAYGGPVLGICAGQQLMAMFAGGSVRPASGGLTEGFRQIRVVRPGGLLAGVPERATVWQHHTDEIAVLPTGFRVSAESTGCAREVIEDPARRWWGTQFHPEEWSDDHPDGRRILENFFALARAGRAAAVTST